MNDLEFIYGKLFDEAKKAYEEGEIPISALIIRKGKILSLTHNLKESQQNAIAHAEILAIVEASKKLNNWRLDGCDLYVSLEPCTMCVSAAHQARVDNIYYFTKKEDCGNFDLLSKIIVEKNSNKELQLHYIEYSDSLKLLLQDFFKARR